MSETPWTPGPWKAIHQDPQIDGGWWDHYIEIPRAGVGSPTKFWLGTSGARRDYGTIAADADLIAAAPEMAKLLADIMRDPGSVSVTPSGVRSDLDYHRPRIEALLARINPGEGRK